jgi:nucleoside-diphosphate-sugar epimerase
MRCAPVALTQERAELRDALRASDVVLLSAAPDASGDPFIADLRALGTDLAGKHLLYLSTVGVYGDHDGAWVDEATPLKPTSRRSLWRAAAEQAWLSLGTDYDAAVQIFRLAGIYGPGQNAFENLIAGTAKRLIKPGQVFNRIHVTDIAAALDAALDKGRPGAIWNVTDNEPAPPQDVVTHAAALMGVAPPPETPFDPATLSPMAASFYGENKRVSNRRLREELGVSLSYPTYREGLAALLPEKVG